MINKVVILMRGAHSSVPKSSMEFKSKFPKINIDKIIGAAIICVAGLFLLQTPGYVAPETVDVSQGLAKLEQLSKADYTETEKEIQDLEAAEATQETDVQVEDQAAAAMSKGQEDDLYNTLQVRGYTQLQQDFEGSIILGDSMVEGLADYGFLPATETVYKRGISVNNIEDLIQTSIGLNPKCVFFQMGINDMTTYEGNVDAFIGDYTRNIQTLQQALPETKIYVNNINPMLPEALEKEPDFQNRDAYNAAIVAMCSQLQITFIDNTSILEGHDELYSKDGIHPLPEYFPYWLTHMLNEAGL
ncbi:MAG: GDSL-type esterase/lipase family protein [Lachnospiraceae bacterium]|nr:GDSL-type esterase/lipase family protein [Lachnospiraceae bacterium]